MPLHVVLHEPEIPNNTGNIGRTCVAAGAALHLVRPLGFDIDEKAVRRAGLDYWPRLALRDHADWQAYLDHREAGDPAGAAPPRRWLLTTKADRTLWEADLRAGDHLVFGKESRGLPEEILHAFPERLVRIPMVPNERSLNLSTSVGIALFEGVRQMLARNQVRLDPEGRLVRPGAA